MEDEIIQLLKERGPLPVYRIAKELRITYGAAQYYIGLLTKRGKVYTVKVGAKRYVALNDQDWLKAVTVEDVVEELNATLRRIKIGPETLLRDALKMLERTAPNVAEVLMLIATTLAARLQHNLESLSVNQRRWRQSRRADAVETEEDG